MAERGITIGDMLARVRDYFGPSVQERAAADSSRFRELASGPGGLGAAMRDPSLRESGLGLAQDFGGLLGSITAYHGSPHVFDRFSLDKIGTGEGAQAYGHGLYFAESPEVADIYRKQLSAPEEYLVGGKPAAEALREPAEFSALGRLRLNGVDIPGARKSLGEQVAAGEQRLEKFRGKPNEARMAELLQEHRAELAALDKLETLGVEKRGGGNFYQVELKPDPEDLLDYDAPLSKQPPKVREAVERALATRPEVKKAVDFERQFLGKEPTGKAIYARLANFKRGSDLSPDPIAGAAASQALREAGIPGLRYLDAGSRDATEGTRNVVLFDDSLVDILERNGQPVRGIEVGR